MGQSCGDFVISPTIFNATHGSSTGTCFFSKQNIQHISFPNYLPYSPSKNTHTLSDFSFIMLRVKEKRIQYLTIEY